jgi:hypothetical protein
MIVGSIVVMIVWQLDLQLPMQSVPIITNGHLKHKTTYYQYTISKLETYFAIVDPV